MINKHIGPSKTVYAGSGQQNFLRSSDAQCPRLSITWNNGENQGAACSSQPEVRPRVCTPPHLALQSTFKWLGKQALV